MPYHVEIQMLPPTVPYPLKRGWVPHGFSSPDIATLKEARTLAEEKADDWADDQTGGWQFRAAIYDTTARDDAPPVAIVRPSKARAKRAELESIYKSLSKMIWPERSKLWDELTRAQRIHFDREYRGIR